MDAIDMKTRILSEEEKKAQGKTPARELYDPFRSCAVLRALNTKLAGTCFALPFGWYVLGRSQDADHVLAHATISRHHCTVLIENARFVITDTNSSHGVEVNGRPVITIELQPDDTILLGDVLLSFEILPSYLLTSAQHVRYPREHLRRPAPLPPPPGSPPLLPVAAGAARNTTTNFQRQYTTKPLVTGGVRSPIRYVAPES